MMLRHISLVNFRNHREASLTFQPGANAFTGGNGTGKTNLLDAIYYLSMCKSYLNPVDVQNIRSGEDLFVIQGVFENLGAEDTVYCGLKKGQRKIFKMNQKEYERLSDHVGMLPVVMISPSDTGLVTEGSEERRRFIDSIISQFDKLYLDNLIQYTRLLSQRNAYLKKAAQSGKFDRASLEIYDEPIIPLGMKIFQARERFINDLNPIFNSYYSFISDGLEEVQIGYDSSLKTTDFRLLLESSLEKDRVLQYTGAGIHKDDLVFRISSMPIRRFASQGQQKSFLISLRLAQFDFIRRIRKLKPILLMDDIFDKLDDLRVSKLMELVSRENFGQLFITDTHPERLKSIFDSISMPVLCFNTGNGNISVSEPELSENNP